MEPASFSVSGTGDTSVAFEVDKQSYVAYWDTALSPLSFASYCSDRLSMAPSAVAVLYLWSVGRNVVTKGEEILQRIKEKSESALEDCAFLRVDINNALSVSWQILPRGKGFQKIPPSQEEYRAIFAYSATTRDQRFLEEVFYDTASEHVMELGKQLIEEVSMSTEHLSSGDLTKGTEDI